MAGDYESFWKEPNEDELLTIAKVLLKYVHFIQPEIILKIVEDNNKGEWIEPLEKVKFLPESYLWHNSSCVYPGVRRISAGEKREFNTSKKLSSENAIKYNAFRFDTNSYPFSIFFYLVNGVGTKRNFPKTKYRLSHLYEHKGNENLHAGLFTSASNICLIPNDLYTISDTSSKVKNLLRQLASAHYSNFLPDDYPAEKSEWDISNFEIQKNFVGEIGNLDSLLNHRKNFLKKAIDKLSF